MASQSIAGSSKDLDSATDHQDRAEHPYTYTTDTDEQEHEQDDGEHQPARTRTQACIAWAIRYRIILEAAGKVVALFILVVLSLSLLLYTLLPPIDPEHRPDVKIPRSFDDLKR